VIHTLFSGKFSPPERNHVLRGWVQVLAFLSQIFLILMKIWSRKKHGINIFS